MLLSRTRSKFFEKPGGAKKGAAPEKQQGIKDMFKKAASAGDKADKGEDGSSSSGAAEMGGSAKAKLPEKDAQKDVEEEDTEMKPVEVEEEEDDEEGE